MKYDANSDNNDNNVIIIKLKIAIRIITRIKEARVISIIKVMNA